MPTAARTCRELSRNSKPLCHNTGRLQDYLGEDVRVLTSTGCELFRDRTENLAFPADRLSEAKIVADNSDVVVLCVGLDETLEGEEGRYGVTATHPVTRWIFSFRRYKEI